MKKLRTIVTMMFFFVIFLGMTSCEIERHADNGRRRNKEYNDHRRPGAVLIIEPNRERRSDDNHDH
jgi:hypothetical protein